MESTVDVSRLRSRASYADLNRNFGSEGAGDLLLDGKAVSQAFFNLFTTIPGEAGPIFEPEFGSLLPLLLQEPMDDITLAKLAGATIQAAQRWEPRAELDLQRTRIEADEFSQSYLVTLVYSLRLNGEPIVSKIRLERSSSGGTAPDQYSNLEYSMAYHLSGWPGLYEFCVVDGSTLRYNSAPYWYLLEEWSDFLSWGSGDPPFFRFTSVIDRGYEASRRLDAEFSGPGSSQVVTVEVATSLDGVSYAPYVLLGTTPLTGRYYKIRVTVQDMTIPMLDFGVVSFYL